VAGPGTAVIAGAGIYFLMIGAVWGYLEGIAREAGLTLIQTGQALSLGLLVSLIGAGAAAWLGLRLGRLLPLLASGIVQTVSLYLLTRLQSFSDPLLAFYLINAVFQIMWSYIIPYFMVMFDEVEPSGRFVSMYGMSTHLTLAIGPYAGAFFIVNGHHGQLLWLGIALVLICYAAFLLAVWLGHKQTGGA
jgi:MFS family permease